MASQTGGWPSAVLAETGVILGEIEGLLISAEFAADEDIQRPAGGFVGVASCSSSFTRRRIASLRANLFPMGCQVPAP